MMNRQTKNCQNCKKDFIIDSEDFNFYEKMKVPVPTFCPECRFQRKISCRNEKNLYKRTCGLCNTTIISMYLENSSFPVYCNNCWYSDDWDPINFGKEFDFKENFFTQYFDLLNSIPRPALIGTKNINSPYVNYSTGLKNSYLMVGCTDDENCSYSYRTFNSKESVDNFGVVNSEYCYECVQVYKSFRTLFARDSENLVDCIFMYDCKNCNDCIGCVGLRNKSHHIFNVEYTKENYFKKKESLI